MAARRLPEVGSAGPTRHTEAMDGFRRTRIVATLGPASEEPRMLRSLIEAGVDVVRLNFSHGTWDEKRRVIETVRGIESDLGRPIAILQDLQGPKIRVGAIPDGPIKLTPGQIVEIYADDRDGGLVDASKVEISTTYHELGEHVNAGDSIFMDDGAIELRIVAASREMVRCEVVVGGPLSSAKGVNLPGARLDVPALSEKDREDLRFGLRHGVDYVAMSFVRSPRDAGEARAVMTEEGIAVPLIAKFEKREAVQQMVAVLRAFDGAMVARGDLGVELRPEKVPGVQKQLIERAIALGKPVITATQMLESMTTHTRPTRAEASDVANAVLDGTHAVMLSGETAVGKYPLETVKAMHNIVVEAERLLKPELRREAASGSVTRAVCASAAYLAQQVGAEALVALTRSGRTAQTLSGLQPATPIIALCERQEMARRLCLWRGVLPLVAGSGLTREDPADSIVQELRRRSVLKQGSLVVALGAAPGGRAGQTNFVRLLRV